MIESGQNVNLCYQCRKCAAGCPISYAMDYKPAQLIHAIRLGMDDLVVNSKTMWLCASCETCTTRCPQEVDVAKVMDAVKIVALRKGIKPAIPGVASFYKAALSNIKKCGRMYELGMIIGLKLRTFDFFYSEHQLKLAKLVEQLFLHVQKSRRPAGLHALHLHDEPVPDLDDPLFRLLSAIRHDRTASGRYLIQINCPTSPKPVCCLPCYCK